jgi:hypothetical protein
MCRATSGKYEARYLPPAERKVVSSRKTRSRKPTARTPANKECKCAPSSIFPHFLGLYTVFRASLSCTTTPTAAKNKVPIPRTVARTPCCGLLAPASIALTAWASEKCFELRFHLVSDRVLFEHQAGDGDCDHDHDQRAKRKDRIIGQRRGNFMGRRTETLSKGKADSTASGLLRYVK